MSLPSRRLIRPTRPPASDSARRHRRLQRLRARLEQDRAWRQPVLHHDAGVKPEIGAALSLGADVIGAATENPEATLPLGLPPLFIFGFLSVGVQPVERFPGWIQPFVRDQMISPFVYALRALAGSPPSRGK